MSIMIPANVSVFFIFLFSGNDRSFFPAIIWGKNKKRMPARNGMTTNNI